jgi:hypothetical protein
MAQTLTIRTVLTMATQSMGDTAFFQYYATVTGPHGEASAYHVFESDAIQAALINYTLLLRTQPKNPAQDNGR